MVKTFFEHVADQYPDDMRKRKYDFWRTLKAAAHDFENPENNKGYPPTTKGFQLWMRERWGLGIEIIDGGWSPYYNVFDNKKYLLFKIKYG